MRVGFPSGVMRFPSWMGEMVVQRCEFTHCSGSAHLKTVTRCSVSFISVKQKPRGVIRQVSTRGLLRVHFPDSSGGWERVWYFLWLDTPIPPLRQGPRLLPPQHHAALSPRGLGLGRPALRGGCRPALLPVHVQVSRGSSYRAPWDPADGAWAGSQSGPLTGQALVCRAARRPPGGVGGPRQCAVRLTSRPLPFASGRWVLVAYRHVCGAPGTSPSGTGVHTSLGMSSTRREFRRHTLYAPCQLPPHE